MKRFNFNLMSDVQSIGRSQPGGNLPKRLSVNFEDVVSVRFGVDRNGNQSPEGNKLELERIKLTDGREIIGRLHEEKGKYIIDNIVKIIPKN